MRVALNVMLNVDGMLASPAPRRGRRETAARQCSPVSSAIKIEQVAFRHGKNLLDTFWTWKPPLLGLLLAWKPPTYHYAIKNHRKSQNNLVGTFSMTLVGSLLHKRAGVDTP